MKKILSVLLVLCLAASMVFAGGSSDKTADGKTKVRLALWDYDAPGEGWQPVMEACMAANPDIELEIISASASDYETKLTTMLASGDDIDLFFAKSNTSYPTVVEMGFAKDLNPIIAKKGYDVTPYGTVLKQHYEIDGGLYALPYRINDWVIFYNKDLFDAAGVEYPTHQMTWEDLLELASKVSDGNGVYGFAFVPKNSFITPAVVGAVDGFDLATSDFKDLIPASEAVKQAMKDGVWEDFAESKSLSKSQTTFFLGYWAMLYDGSWMGAQNNNNNVPFEWGIVKSPYWAGTEKNGFATSTPLLMNAKTKNEEAAWQILTWICGAPGAQEVAKSQLVPGYMTDETMDIFREATGLDDDSMYALTDNVTYALGEATPLLGKLNDALNQEFELYLTDNQTAEEMAAALEKRRAEILR